MSGLAPTTVVLNVASIFPYGPTDDTEDEPSEAVAKITSFQSAQ